MQRALITTLLLSSAAVSLAAQWSVPHNSFGQPDLEGVRTNATVTTLERPSQFETLILDADTARTWENQTNGLFESIDDVPDGELKAGDNVGGYNSFWMDPGTQLMRVDGEYRSSLLVEPQDGKLPMRVGARAKLFAFLARVNGAFDGPEQRPLGERCIVGFGSTGGCYPCCTTITTNSFRRQDIY